MSGSSESGGGLPLDVVILGGCGHVGLPLALSFADVGKRVGIYDLDEQAVERVRAGEMPFRESGAEDLLTKALTAGRLELATDPSILKRSEVTILVVGTPIDEFLRPSLKVFNSVADDIAPWLAQDGLVILRSTAYPGTTDWMATALAERGCTVDLAFCPERIAEGRALEELTSLPQIIGAREERAAARAEEVFSALGVPTLRTSPEEAELAKLFTNTWRYMKFAVANQFFLIAQQARLDYGKILHAVRWDYPRAADLPSPGFAAGPCLLKDTMQLSAYAGSGFVLGHAAMLVNESLPDEIVHALERDEGLRGKTVAILGMAFKAESDDTRASLSYKLKKLLWFAGAEVLCSDLFVDDPDLIDAETAVGRADIVVIGTPHPGYSELDFSKVRLVDPWGITSDAQSRARSFSL